MTSRLLARGRDLRIRCSAGGSTPVALSATLLVALITAFFVMTACLVPAFLTPASTSAVAGSTDLPGLGARIALAQEDLAPADDAEETRVSTNGLLLEVPDGSAHYRRSGLADEREMWTLTYPDGSSLSVVSALRSWSGWDADLEAFVDGGIVAAVASEADAQDVRLLRGSYAEAYDGGRSTPPVTPPRVAWSYLPPTPFPRATLRRFSWFA